MFMGAKSHRTAGASRREIEARRAQRDKDFYESITRKNREYKIQSAITPASRNWFIKCWQKLKGYFNHGKS